MAPVRLQVEELLEVGGCTVVHAGQRGDGGDVLWGEVVLPLEDADQLADLLQVLIGRAHGPEAADKGATHSKHRRITGDSQATQVAVGIAKGTDSGQRESRAASANHGVRFIDK